MGTVQRAVIRTANRAGRALGTHTTVTNVPGPQTPIYFCGAKCVVQTGMAPIVDGMGLMNAVGSYHGTVPICFTSDRDMMPDPEFYEECLVASFEELLTIAEPAAPARRSTTRSKPTRTRSESKRSTSRAR